MAVDLHFHNEILRASSRCHLGPISILEWICCLGKFRINRMAVAFALDCASTIFAHLMIVLTEYLHWNEGVALWVPPIQSCIFRRMDEEQVSVVAVETIRLQSANSKLAWLEDACRRAQHVVNHNCGGFVPKTWFVL